MMMTALKHRYNITIRLPRYRTYEVIATSEEEAKDKAMYVETAGEDIDVTEIADDYGEKNELEVIEIEDYGPTDMDKEE